MTDIVERLRAVDASWSETGELCAEAADALEALGGGVGVDEATVLPGQIPPFLHAPTFDDRNEPRVCINGCLYLRADFAGDRIRAAIAALKEPTNAD